MTLELTTHEMLARFDQLYELVQSRAPAGVVSLRQVMDCHRLARELESEQPDPERVTTLADRLDLDPEELP